MSNEIMTQDKCGSGPHSPIRRGPLCQYTGIAGRCKMFYCPKCKKLYPWCQGAADNQPSRCDFCWTPNEVDPDADVVPNLIEKAVTQLEKPHE